MAHLDATKAVVMPSGTLHSVWTIVKGFVITLGYLESRSVQGMSYWIRWNPSAVKEEDKSILIENWTNAASMDLYTTNSRVVLESWLLVADSILQYAKEVSDQARRLSKLWSDYSNHYLFTEDLRRTYAPALLSSVRQLDENLDEYKRKSGNANKRGRRRRNA